jgi:hypothetical protein
MSVNVHEDEYTLSKPAMTRTYTLGAGACDNPLNGGEPSELEKIVDKKRILQTEEEEDRRRYWRERDEDEEEDRREAQEIEFGWHWEIEERQRERQRKKRALHIDDLQIDEEEEDRRYWREREEDEEEEGIGCNECYACVTGGGKPCLKETNIEKEP